LRILSKITGKEEPPSKRTWRRYFEARIAVITEWYGLPRDEVLGLVAEKMELGYRGDAVFDAVKKDLEARRTKIIERR